LKRISSCRHGAVEFHDLDNGYRKLPLETASVRSFPAAGNASLISNGDLVILGMMGNAGWPSVVRPDLRAATG
jgi:hypothetical protein